MTSREVVQPYPLRLAALVLLLIGSAGAAWCFHTQCWIRPPHGSDDRRIQLISGIVASNYVAIESALREFAAFPVSIDAPPTELFHRLYAHGDDFPIVTKSGESVSCLDHLLETSATSASPWSRSLIVSGPHGWVFRPGGGVGGAGFEAHPGEFLWYGAMGGLNPSMRMRRPDDGQTISMRDLLGSYLAMASDSTDFAYLLPLVLEWSPDFKSESAIGFKLDASAMLHSLMTRPELSGECFGTHYCFALAFAKLKMRISRDDLAAVSVALDQYLDSARRSMNEVFQFGLLWAGPPPGALDDQAADAALQLMEDENILLSHQAHMLDWIVLASGDTDFVQEKWIHEAAFRLWHQLRNGSPRELTQLSQCHAIAALRRYAERVSVTPAFSAAVGQAPPVLDP